jgi:hypothetical protein
MKKKKAAGTFSVHLAAQCIPKTTPRPVLVYFLPPLAGLCAWLLPATTTSRTWIACPLYPCALVVRPSCMLSSALQTVEPLVDGVGSWHRVNGHIKIIPVIPMPFQLLARAPLPTVLMTRRDKRRISRPV